MLLWALMTPLTWNINYGCILSQIIFIKIKILSDANAGNKIRF